MTVCGERGAFAFDRDALYWVEQGGSCPGRVMRLDRGSTTPIEIGKLPKRTMLHLWVDATRVYVEAVDDGQLTTLLATGKRGGAFTEVASLGWALQSVEMADDAFYYADKPMSLTDMTHLRLVRVDKASGTKTTIADLDDGAKTQLDGPYITQTIVAGDDIYLVEDMGSRQYRLLQLDRAGGKPKTLFATPDTVCRLSCLVDANSDFLQRDECHRSFRPKDQGEIHLVRVARERALRREDHARCGRGLLRRGSTVRTSHLRRRGTGHPEMGRGKGRASPRFRVLVLPTARRDPTEEALTRPRIAGTQFVVGTPECAWRNAQALPGGVYCLRMRVVDLLTVIALGCGGKIAAGPSSEGSVDGSPVADDTSTTSSDAVTTKPTPIRDASTTDAAPVGGACFSFDAAGCTGGASGSPPDLACKFEGSCPGHPSVRIACDGAGICECFVDGTKVCTCNAPVGRDKFACAPDPYKGPACCWAK